MLIILTPSKKNKEAIKGTVKELIRVFKCERNEVKLAWNGCLRDFDPEDPVEVDAFGRYEVEYATITAYQDGDKIEKHIEVDIAMAPVIGKEAGHNG